MKLRQGHASPGAVAPINGQPLGERGLDDLLEEFGLYLESSGLPRAAGRMLAWLLICDPPEQSAEDLGRALSASTGGVSMTVRLLARHGFVQRIGRAGDRKVYYRVVPGAWATVLASEQANASHLRELGVRGLSLLPDHDRVRRRRLEEMTGFYTFLERELPALIQRYHDERNSDDE